MRELEQPFSAKWGVAPAALLRPACRRVTNDALHARRVTRGVRLRGRGAAASVTGDARAGDTTRNAAAGTRTGCDERARGTPARTASCCSTPCAGSAEPPRYADSALASRHDRDAAVALEHGALDVFEPIDPAHLPRRAQDVLFVDALDVHARAQRDAIPQKDERLAFEQPVDARQPTLHERQQYVRADEHDDEQKSARNRSVIANEGLLRRFGDDQQQHKIERRRVA